MSAVLCKCPEALHAGSKNVTSIDPVMEVLMQFKNKEHLHELIDMLFFIMDENQNGILEFQDIHQGFKNFKVPVVIDEEAWADLSGGHLENITREMFKDCMIRQLQVYMETLVADEMLMASITDGENRNTLTGLKLMMLNTSLFPTHDRWSQPVSAADTLVEIRRMLLLQASRLTRLEKALNVDTSVPLIIEDKFEKTEVEKGEHKPLESEEVVEVDTTSGPGRSQSRRQRSKPQGNRADEGGGDGNGEEESLHDKENAAGITPPVVKRERKSRRERKKSAGTGVGEEQDGQGEKYKDADHGGN